jgi:hypothetical protein
VRYVLNSAKRKYQPYAYFCHKHNGKIKWCYLGKLSNNVENGHRAHRCIDCINLTQDNFCLWQGAYIGKEELLTAPFECEGFHPRPLKSSNKSKEVVLQNEVQQKEGKKLVRRTNPEKRTRRKE